MPVDIADHLSFITYFKVTDPLTEAVSVTHHCAGRGQGRWPARGLVGRGTHLGNPEPDCSGAEKSRPLIPESPVSDDGHKMAFCKHLSVSAPAWGRLS